MRAFKICERSGKLPRGEIKEKTSFLENFKGCKKNNMFIHNGKKWILENLEDFVGKIVKKDPFLRGTPGKEGKDGMNGRRGETGFGYSGATGATGPRGENGMNGIDGIDGEVGRSEEHTSELQSQSNLVCRLLLEKKNNALAHSEHTSPISTNVNKKFKSIFT